MRLGHCTACQHRLTFLLPAWAPPFTGEQVTVPEYMLSGQEAPSEECDGEVTKILPRGQLLVHGGDLAYPNPTGKHPSPNTQLWLLAEEARGGC